MRSVDHEVLGLLPAHTQGEKRAAGGGAYPPLRLHPQGGPTPGSGYGLGVTSYHRVA